MPKINHEADTLDKALGVSPKEKKALGKTFVHVMDAFMDKHQKASIMLEDILNSGHAPIHCLFLAYNAGTFVGEKRASVNVMGRLMCDIERISGHVCKHGKKAKGKK